MEQAHAAKPERVRPRTIVLVGFMAAGKSAVGRGLARRLGWRFHDVDEEIVARTGSSIADLFEREGEPAFRELERGLTATLVCQPDAVIATGGGWAAREDAFEELPAGVAAVWLRISAGEAVRRARASAARRPLLESRDPVATASALLASREPLYARARWRIDVDGRDVEDVIEEIVNLLHQV